MHKLLAFLLPALLAAPLLAKTALIVEPYIPDAALVAAAEKCARDAGYETRRTGFDGIEKNWVSFDLTVFCDGSCLPQSLLAPFWHYLNNGRTAVFFGAPAWERPLVKINGRWTVRDEYARRKACLAPARPIYDFKNGLGKDWSRECQETNSVMGWEQGHDPYTGFYYYAFKAEFPGGYDYVSYAPEEPFPQGCSVTMLSAKGDSKTTSVAAGWTEKDGSRWKTKLVLEEGWTLHYIEADRLEYAGGNEARRDTKFSPENAEAFFVGLDGSTDNTYREHSFCIGGLGTCPSDETTRALAPISNTGLDYMSLAPDNAFFEMHGAASFKAPGVFAKPEMPAEMRSSHMRPSAAGYGKDRDWRWLSWSRCETEEGDWRGNPVAGLVRFDNSQKFSRYAAFAISDRSWYKKESSQKYITEIISDLDRGVFLQSAGTDRFTYTEGQKVTAGLKLANVSKEARKAAFRITVTRNSDGRKVFEWFEEQELSPESMTDKSREVSLPGWDKTGYRVRADVSVDGRLADTASHDIYLWKPDRSEPFVEARGGKFYKGDREIKLHGVNYHPTCTTSSWNWALFLEWFGKDFYDPEVIERDLDNMNRLSINAVSVQIYNSYPNKPKYDNVIDFLRRCRNHGILVNLALVSNPKDKDFRERFDFWTPIIRELRLPENPTVMAYDIDWEPTWLDPGYRKQFDGDWTRFVEDRYGSVENAEKIWGCSITRDDKGEIENPSIPVLHRDSAKRGESLAYKRFLEYEAYKKYRYARDLYREVDPNHLVSFRMHAAGDVCSWYGLYPYSFYYLGKAVDFFAPEAYSMGTTWEDHMKTGLFTRAIAGLSNPDLPMVYAEVGYKTIEGERPFASEQGLRKQAQYFRDFYRMLIEGGVNGVFWWFWPGGYRVLEASDYGIINPDDSDKPVTRVVREMGRKFLEAPSFEPDAWITVDTSRHVDYTDALMLYNQSEAEYLRLLERGKKPGLRAEAFGSDTRSCDWISVTNSPFQKGVRDLPKYVDGAIDAVLAGSERVTEEDAVRAGETLEVTLANLNEAAWLDGDGEGSVLLMANDVPYTLPGVVKTGERVRVRVTVPEGDLLTLRLCAKERGFFGETVRLKIR